MPGLQSYLRSYYSHHPYNQMQMYKCTTSWLMNSIGLNAERILLVPVADAADKSVVMTGTCKSRGAKELCRGSDPVNSKEKWFVQTKKIRSKLLKKYAWQEIYQHGLRKHHLLNEINLKSIKAHHTFTQSFQNTLGNLITNQIYSTKKSDTSQLSMRHINN